jgi:hypothetical protein
MNRTRPEWQVLTSQTYAEARELCLTEKQREKAQQIYVLRDGFSGFQSKFRVSRPSTSPGGPP